MECKPGCVNVRRVSDPRRAFQPAFRVTGMSDNCYRSTMGVIVIGLGIPWSTGENFGCTWEHLGKPAISLGALMTSLGAPGSTGVKSGCTNNKSGCASEKSGCTGHKSRRASDKSASVSNHSRAVWEKQHLLWECGWGAWKS